ncbi:hypothetical protein Hanom_Chr11g00995501 [Helianthus anomalus]
MLGVLIYLQHKTSVHPGARLGPLFRPIPAFLLRFKSPTFRPSGAFSGQIPTKFQSKIV